MWGEQKEVVTRISDPAVRQPERGSCVISGSDGYALKQLFTDGFQSQCKYN